MGEGIIILLQFKDGKYPEIKEQAWKCEDIEVSEIIDFFNDVINRANRYKENEKHYPQDIEDLIGWEELNFNI